MSLNDIHSLSHTSWNGKYHIVFAPKYRRKVFYKGHRAAIGKVLRQLCEWKGVDIIEAEVCPDHIHMLVEIPPKLADRITHLTCCDEQRAMPAYEKPPARLVDVYCRSMDVQNISIVWPGGIC